MKRIVGILFAAALLVAVAGCLHHSNCDPCRQGDQCQSCKPCALHGPGCRGHNGQAEGPGPYNPGPPTGQVTYPYYTTRGPRDFLQRVPTPIGP